MISKTFEIRDRNTFIPALCIRIQSNDERDNYLFKRAGYGDIQHILIHLQNNNATYDPYCWDNHTMQFAHQYIHENFEELTTGQVIDVEYLQGLTKEPKTSESLRNQSV